MVPMDDRTVIFAETQPWWLNRLLQFLLPMESMIMTAVLFAVASKSPPQDQWIIFWVWLGTAVVFPAGFLCWRLKTSVTPTTLRVRFAGLPGWRIPLESVALAEAVRVEPMRDFGGWGWRASKKFGQVFNVWGHEAVRITLVNGKVRTVGTQRARELAEAVLSGAIGEPGAVHSLPVGSSNA
jgi:hypothetical protein